jgi:hypothetical protein
LRKDRRRLRIKTSRLDHIELLPLELGFGRPRSQRGRPMIADGAKAQRILDRVRGLSEPYGHDRRASW